MAGNAVLAVGATLLGGGLLLALTRKAKAAPPPGEREPEAIEIIDAEYRSGNVLWTALTRWKKIYINWVNQWPADTDITLAWEIKNIGNADAYFQVYMFSPGAWMYLGVKDKLQVTEEFHTPAVPVIPGYNYYRINILARKITGERIGAVWTSDEVEILYV